MQEKPTLDLSDKIVFVYKANGDNDVALVNPHIELHHGRYFLAGKVADGGSSNDWLTGLTTYVAWDQIEEFILFDSMEEFFDRLSRSWAEKNLQ